MRVLVVNAGSSSLKLTVVENGQRLHEQQFARGAQESDEEHVREFVDGVGNTEVEAIGHRVVHGGADYPRAVAVDQALLDYLESPTGLAPLHNPVAAELVRATSRVLPDLDAVACFDTTYFQDLLEAAATYAVPRAWIEQWGLRRFGAHGLSHAYAARRAAHLVGSPLADLRVLTCHLGSGSSVAAVRHGRPVDTTMGLTPLEGLVMSTRSGTVDPGMLLWLARHAGLGLDQIDDALQHESGLRGLCGTGDLREVMAARSSHPEAALAYDVYAHRLRREIAAMAAATQGVDVLAFTGGIGEHAADLRRDTVDGLAHLGLTIDPERNQGFSGDGDVSLGGSAAQTIVLRSGEDLEIASQAQLLLEGTYSL